MKTSPWHSRSRDFGAVPQLREGQLERHLIEHRGTELVIKPTRVFPPTELESTDTPSVYQGRPLSLKEMEQAVSAEAGKHK